MLANREGGSILADDAPEHMEISRTCPVSDTYLKFIDFPHSLYLFWPLPLLLPSFVQEESNIRNIPMGKYIFKVLSEEPDELCTSVLEENPKVGYGVKTPCSIKMCSQFYLPTSPCTKSSPESL